MKWKNIIDYVGILAILIGLFFVYKELELSSTIARAQMSAETNNGISASYDHRRVRIHSKTHKF